MMTKVRHGETRRLSDEDTIVSMVSALKRSPVLASIALGLLCIAGLFAFAAFDKHPASSTALEWTGLYRHVYLTPFQSAAIASGVTVLAIALVGVTKMIVVESLRRKQLEEDARRRLEETFIKEQVNQQREAMRAKSALVMGHEVESYALGPWAIRDSAASRIMADVDRHIQSWLSKRGMPDVVTLRESTGQAGSMAFNALTVHVRGNPVAESVTVVLEFELLQVMPNLKANVRCYAAMRAEGDVAQYRMGSADVPLQPEWEETAVRYFSDSFNGSTGFTVSESTKYTWSGVDNSAPVKDFYASWRNAYRQGSRNIDMLKDAMIRITNSAVGRYSRPC